MRKLPLLSILCLTLMLMAGCGGGDNGTPNPEISSLQPDSGPPGTMVTIDGSGFSPDTSANSVTFGGTAAPVSSASESTIETTVPDLSSGSAPVEVTIGDQTASGPAFSVEQAAPGISAVEPDSGTVGTEVTISGMNFGATASENTISFAGTDAPVNSAAEDELVTEVPQGAADGPIEVTVKQKSTTGPDFDVITEGALEVTTNSTGDDIDGDGYTVTADGTSESVSSSGSTILANLSEGDVDAELSGIAGNCTVDGNNPQTVTITAGDTTSASFDIECQAVADGKIAFTSDRDGNNEIYLMNADGSSPTNLTNNTANDIEPEISHDGTKIAFASSRSGDEGLYIMDADGSNVRQVTSSGAHISVNSSISWSPGDSTLAFSDSRSGGEEIYTIGIDGSNLTRLTNNTVRDNYPSWSPDGSKIAYGSDTGTTRQVYTMSPDGSDRQQVTTSNDFNGVPRWSPNDSRIAFVTNRDGNSEVYTINNNGANLQRVTNNPAFDTDAAWSPDGSEIAFTSDRDGNDEVFKINADGSGSLIDLTANSSADIAPHWSPVQ